jgi:DNA-binding transcriptional MerR regulator
MVEGLHSEPNMEIANDRRLKIGELARQTGLSIKTIRYYESRGLLEKPPRTEGGYRLYGPEEVARLRFVQRAKLLGLTLEEIRELVEVAVRCNEGEIVPRLEEVLEAKLKETKRKMAELSAFHQNLLYYRERASALSDGVLPTDRYCEDVSFCGCLEAVTAKGGEELRRMIVFANTARCLATSADVTAAASRNRVEGLSPALYSPECLE